MIVYIILILVVALFGAATLEIPGLILGGLSGYLLAEILLMRKKIAALEKKLEEANEPGWQDVEFTLAEKEGDEEDNRDLRVETEPEQSAHPVERPVFQERFENGVGKEQVKDSNPEYLTPFDRFFSSLEKIAGTGADGVRRFITGGNLVLKAGLIILFFGVAFLLKYAAQQNLFPIEARLMAVAVGGLVLLVLGYRLRNQALDYGLALQGGGVGILYLVVFAASKLYTLLPLQLAFGIMVGLVALSAALAVLQDSRWLAIFGVVGGFLAPVLMSTGSGNHVLLFSYFGLLNAGIVVIAWFKAWRELNLIGFFFTFGIGTLWGSQGYRPEFFGSTEPFLIAYFLFYVAISVLFAHRQPVNLRGYIDGPLVFGLPLVVSSLQYLLVKDTAFGMALSACGFGIFYLLLATVLWRRLAEGMRLLCEAFLALGVVFASLTLPLALDSNWTTAAWALEGAAMIWVGVRQNRQLARIFALLLQFGAAWIFVESVFYPFGATPFLNRYFFGCAFLSGSALFTSYYLQKHLDRLSKWERFLPIPMLIWGMCWWYYGGIRETDRYFSTLRDHDAFLLFCSASTMFMSIIARKTSWRELAVAQLVLLPAMFLTMLFGLLDISWRTHLLAEWGALSWFLAFFCQYRMLHQFDSLWPQRLAGCWHVGTFWLFILLLCLEASWFMDTRLDLAEVWAVVGWGIIPALAVSLLLRFGDRLRWPVASWRSWFLGPAIYVPVVGLVGWSVATLGVAGDPAPLHYIPVFNPLELSLLFALMVIVRWAVDCRRGQAILPKFINVRGIYWLIAVLGFFWLNGVVARGVHFYTGIPYYSESLYQSVVFQAAIAALWSLIALSTTVWAARTGDRLVWCCGAGLLALVVIKLFVIDLSGTGTIARIVSFLSVGILMLVIGYFSPIPPNKDEVSP